MRQQQGREPERGQRTRDRSNATIGSFTILTRLWSEFRQVTAAGVASTRPIILWSLALPIGAEGPNCPVATGVMPCQESKSTCRCASMDENGPLEPLEEVQNDGRFPSSDRNRDAVRKSSVNAQSCGWSLPDLKMSSGLRPSFLTVASSGTPVAGRSWLR